MSTKYIKIQLDDGQIVEFPADMSEQEIMSAIHENFPKETKTGWEGVGQDISESVRNLPENLWEAVKTLPGVIGGGLYQGAVDPGRATKNLFAGLGKGGAGTLNIPANIRDYLVSKNLASEKTPSFRLPESILPRNYNYAEGVGVKGHEAGDEFWQGLGENAPYALAGELGTLRALPRMGARAGAQIPFAIGQNEDPLAAALTPTLFETLLRGGAGTVNQLRPANLFRGTLSPDELRANLRAAGGTDTPLPNIIGSPTLKQVFENATAKVPGGGGDQALGRIGQQVENRGGRLLEESGGDLGPGDRNAQLKNALETAYREQVRIKNDLYRPVNELAQQEGFFLDLNSFRNRANRQINEIADSPLMQYDLDFRNAFNRLAGLSEGAEGSPTILDANMTANKLHTDGSRLIESPTAHDRYIGNLYLDLAERIHNDINTELRQRGSRELRDAYQTATDNYRENFSQFLDKDVYKLTQPHVEAETIVNDIIRPGKRGDKYSRIEKIQNVLPEEQRNILGNAWLRHAIDKEGHLNPKKLAKSIEELGPRQFEALFPDPAYRQRLLDYGRLRGMNEKALSRLANPATGQSLFVPSMLLSQAQTAFNAFNSGHPLLGLAALVGPQVASKAFNYAMTSPQLRQNMIQRMIEGQTSRTARNLARVPMATPALTAIAEGSKSARKPFMVTQDGYEVYD